MEDGRVVSDIEPELTGKVIGAALEVHRALGPGLLESCSESRLAYELIDRGMQVQRQVELPLIIEIKSVDELSRIHEAQLLMYLGLSGHRVGLPINFNKRLLKDGIKRRVL